MNHKEYILDEKIRNIVDRELYIKKVDIEHKEKIADIGKKIHTQEKVLNYFDIFCAIIMLLVFVIALINIETITMNDLIYYVGCYAVLLGLYNLGYTFIVENKLKKKYYDYYDENGVLK